MTSTEKETLAFVLDGLACWLETERERGARVVEVDRDLLRNETAPSAAEEPQKPVVAGPKPVQPAPRPSTSSRGPSSSSASYVFLHDRPLSEAGREMMSKIVAALGKTKETAPVVVDLPLPPAKAYVVLGALALRKFFPGVKGEPGRWVKGGRGEDVLVTYSPAFILRFPTMTDAVMKMKRDMWTSLKDLMRRYP